ncbi:hypothetical protein KAR91_54540 [Candidatus Pacearchaeota archaeon]|nr:hypothetical protein [Candidatus Pacearchaeota archaeon]
MAVPVKGSIRRELNPGEQITKTVSYVSMLSPDNDTISTFTATTTGAVTVSNLSHSDNIGTYTITASGTAGATGCVTFKMTSSATPPVISNIRLIVRLRDDC